MPARRISGDERAGGATIMARKRASSVHTQSRHTGTTIATNRPAAFPSAATNGFQFRREKGWKILLFERLALFL
jgi:hypothetical protein